MREWTLEEYWTIKLVLFPIALFVIVLWFYLGFNEIFGKLGSVIIIGLPFVVIYILIVQYQKKKEEREMKKIEKLDNEWLDNYIKNK